MNKWIEAKDSLVSTLLDIILSMLALIFFILLYEYIFWRETFSSLYLYE